MQNAARYKHELTVNTVTSMSTGTAQSRCNTQQRTVAVSLSLRSGRCIVHASGVCSTLHVVQCYEVVQQHRRSGAHQQRILWRGCQGTQSWHSQPSTPSPRWAAAARPAGSACYQSGLRVLCSICMHAAVLPRQRIPLRWCMFSTKKRTNGSKLYKCTSQKVACVPVMVSSLASSTLHTKCRMCLLIPAQSNHNKVTHLPKLGEW